MTLTRAGDVQDEFIPFHRASIGAAERAAVDEVLADGWLTTGLRAQRFETEFARAVGSRHAVALNSATAALHLAFDALGIGDGDEVVVPTYTFAASAESALYLRARPVLADVDPVTLNLAPAAVRSAITARTRAVEVVHFAGLPADMPGIFEAIAAAVPDPAARPAVVEDTAHAFPSPISAMGGRLAGTVGAAGAFSFYATKTITTGEGGMLVTDDDAIAARARTMRLHGISRDAWKRYTASGSWYYDIEAVGYKYNLTDLAAALGLVQLTRSEEFKEARRRIAEQYRDRLGRLADAGSIILPAWGEADDHAWHLFVVRLADVPSSVTAVPELPGVAPLPAALHRRATLRAQVIERMKALGIGVSVHFIPLHLHPLYRSMGYAPGDLPVAEEAFSGALSLPIWPGMTPEQIDRVADALILALEEQASPAAMAVPNAS